MIADRFTRFLTRPEIVRHLVVMRSAHDEGMRDLRLDAQKTFHQDPRLRPRARDPGKVKGREEVSIQGSRLRPRARDLVIVERSVSRRARTEGAHECTLWKRREERPQRGLRLATGGLSRLGDGSAARPSPRAAAQRGAASRRTRVLRATRYDGLRAGVAYRRRVLAPHLGRRAEI